METKELLRRNEIIYDMLFLIRETKLQARENKETNTYNIIRKLEREIIHLSSKL
jgi:hypothetical protein